MAQLPAKRFLARAVVGACLALLIGDLLAAEPPDFTAAANKISPSVVKIDVQQLGLGSFPAGLEPPADASQQQSTLGSGIIISSDGYILTCAHVIASAGLVKVTRVNGRHYQAAVVGVDRDSDLALLKIDAKVLPTAPIGGANTLVRGQWVAAIGAPFGFATSVTAGIVSATGRHLGRNKYIRLIQTDVPINPGSSGGPLINAAGKVVGVNAEIFSSTGEYVGVSFAVPIQSALNIAGQLETNGTVKRGWLGVSVQQVTPALAREDGMKKPVGARVTDVFKGSPAARSGLRVGDVIVGFNGHDVGRPHDLPPLVGWATVGETARLTVWRAGGKIQVGVRIGRLEHNTADFVFAVDSSRIGWLGLAVRNISEEQAQRLKIDHGVLVQYASSAARNAGIVPGDIILRAARKRVDSAHQLTALQNKVEPDTLIPVLILHGKERRFVALKVPAP